MRNDIYNYVTNFSSLIGLPLRRTLVRSTLYSSGPSSIFFPKGRSGTSLQYQAFITSISVIEYIQTNKELYHLHFPFGGEGAYSQQ